MNGSQGLPRAFRISMNIWKLWLDSIKQLRSRKLLQMHFEHTRVSSIQWEGMRCEFNSAHLNIFMTKFYVCDWKTHFMINGTSISDVERGRGKRQTTIRSRWLLNRFMNVIFLWHFRPKLNLNFIHFSFLTHLFPRHDMACSASTSKSKCGLKARLLCFSSFNCCVQSK